MPECPVCHVSTDQVIDQPPKVLLPSIPEATDLNSALAAINAMRQMLLLLAGQIGRGGAQGPPGAAGKSAQKEKVGRWNEVSRSTSKVKVFNPDDKTQFVEVERINKLTMKDSVTNEQWIWNRGK
jgi:hypothetical protein